MRCPLDMKNFNALIALGLFTALSSTALAAPGGRLDTIPLGLYRCALPGDAAGLAWVPQNDRNFTIGNASTYQTADGSGTYLHTGKTVVFTRGPMRGMQFSRTGNSTLRLLDDEGQPSPVRCVRNGSMR